MPLVPRFLGAEEAASGAGRGTAYHKFLELLDFEKEYNFQDGDLLLLISINGNTFYFDKRVVHHILKCSVNTWLISCKDNINFSKNYLYIPTLNDKYNDYLLRHILDFILMY